MMNRLKHEQSLSEVHESIDVNTKGTKWKRVLAFFGPAYLVSVGYMDPGNWATDLAGGSKFGYALIWVLLMSNIMALLLQSLSARLGIVRGRDLAQANRETYPKTINFFLYILAEVAIAATDLAEVLGMAIGIHLLTDIPIIWGVAITVLDTILLLYLQRLGIRKMEAFIIGLVAVVGLSFFVEILLVKPDLREVSTGFVPTLPNNEALYIAIGIIGATVMPHNLYLHSALVQTRKIDRTRQGIKQALKWSFVDSAIALNIAFLVNAAILVLAATAFFKNGLMVDEIKNAHQLLSGVLGSKVAPVLFAIALIAAGQSSTVTGTLAGQIVMEGYLRLRINPWIRRLLTRLLAIVPAIIVIYIFGDKEVDFLLILSQVILSMQLGFAVIPLIHFVSDKKTMGPFAIKPIVQAAAWLIAAVLVYLNIKMVLAEAGTVFDQPGNNLWKTIIVVAGILFLVLLAFTIFYPLVSKRPKPVSIQMHPDVDALKPLIVPTYRKIAVALEFGEHDSAILAHAIGQGKNESEYVLIHIVESASARLLGQESDDFETRADDERLQFYIRQLSERGFSTTGHLGFRHRAKEIVRLVKENNADMLVIGAHRHTGVKDWLYGETINSVRHELTIPVLVVNL
ncbi:Nramp family divalent metal transporter [Paraflavitalea sp. CAU 1676]|uniref:Nramp family divalent metal transporter n=1 Tax=Paraflavitalea sp. CAU 1676 TaxID=3032598 RepID=UPI0023D9D0A4|nr:Nramp family divalent metal transporter [Paraflavitalea sp. CAU 1676]MDF2190001.1 Nramp family divalent metal transporter [Paraflavitalea sp. CAU 1676]